MAMANSYWMPSLALGGGDRRAIEILKRAQKKHLDVSVVSSDDGIKAYKSHLSARYHSTGKGAIGAYPYGLMVSYVLRIFSAIGKIFSLPTDFDVLYTTTDFLPDVVPSLVYKIAFPRVTWIQVIHHVIPNPGMRRGKFGVNIVSFATQRLSFEIIKRHSDRVMLTNSGLRRNLIRIGFSPRKLTVSGSGVDVPYFRSIIPADTSYDAVYLGHIRPSKALPLLLEIWKKVHESLPEATLAIIGSGSRPEALRTLAADIKRAGLSDVVFPLGYVEDSLAFRIVKAAKVFLNPSLEEGWSLSSCEAIACGTPVLSWSLPVYQELYGNTIITVPTGNTHEFAKRVIQLLRDPILRRYYADALYQGMLSIASWEKIAQTEFDMPS